MPTRNRGATAEERVQRLVALQRLLGGFARDIGPTLELEGVLHTALSAMRTLIEFRGGSIQLIDEDGVYIAAADPEVSEDVRAARVPLGRGLSGRVAASGETVYSPNVDADPRVDQKLRRTGTNAAMKSYLGIPLVCLGQVIGLLQVESDEIDAFGADDILVLEGLAAQIAGAIETARRHEQVMELERMKSDFIARVSHELRTPLTIMAGFTDTLLMHGEQLDAERRRQVLERLKTSVQRLSALIEDILTVSSLEAGMTRPSPESIAVGDLLAHVKAAALDEGRVTVEAPPGLRVVTDPRLLRHALGLLVDNALKYAGDAHVTARQDGDNVVFAVRDHGPGVPPKDRDKMFERFWRGNHTGAGMGLGLPVVRQLTASLDAKLHVADADGGGMEFSLVVPA